VCLLESRWSVHRDGAVWSCLEERVIARGEGHRSWVNVVSFDAYTTNVSDNMSLDSDDEGGYCNGNNGNGNGNGNGGTQHVLR